MHLVKPCIEFKESFLSAASAIIEEGYANFIKAAVNENNFSEYVEYLIGQETGIGVPKGYVNASFFWLIDNNEFIGKTSVRHRLSESLQNMGGHIGYIIAPAHRKKGYGKKILELALKEAGQMGIKRTLVTCNKTNLASAKIIEANSGVLENEVFIEDRGHWERRYWITIS